LRAFGSRETFVPALSAGVAAGFIFSISMGAGSGGILFVSLPVLLAGLALGARSSGITCFIACATTGLLTGPAGALFFAGFIALPVYYFIRQALMWRGPETRREWYPALRLLSELTILVAAAFMLLAIGVADQGGLEAIVPHNLTAGMKNADPDFTAAMQQFTGELGFAFLALIGWAWITTLYAFAVIANAVLKAKSYALRPSLAIEPRGLPGWLLLLLIVSGLLALLGQKADRFTAETVFLILLLPYLLSGLAFVHEFSVKRGIPFRKAWLACFYIALACARWPLLGVIAIGLYLQLAEILDRGKKIR
jgi:hypothetical protein